MILIMSVDSEDSKVVFVPENDLLACPFVELCELPKHRFLCKVPDCRIICSEYLSKVRKLKAKAYL